MDVLDSHKSKTATSIAYIGTMQDADDFTSLCVNSNTIMVGMFSAEGPHPLYRLFLLMYIMTVNSCNWVIGLPRMVEICQASIGICVFFSRGSSTYLRIS